LAELYGVFFAACCPRSLRMANSSIHNACMQLQNKRARGTSRFRDNDLYRNTYKRLLAFHTSVKSRKRLVYLYGSCVPIGSGDAATACFITAPLTRFCGRIFASVLSSRERFVTRRQAIEFKAAALNRFRSGLSSILNGK
jgi:hypothetical protein